MVPRHPRRQVPRHQGAARRAEGHAADQGLVRRVRDELRDGDQGEGRVSGHQVALRHHRRSAPHQKRKVRPLPSRQAPRHRLPPADHGHAPAEQPAGAVGAAPLSAAGNVFVGRRVRGVVCARRRRRGRPRRGRRRARRGGRDRDRVPAAQGAAPVPAAPAQERRRKGAAPQKGDDPQNRHVRRPARHLPPPPQDRRRLRQRRHRPVQAAERGHAAAQVLQPPVPVPGRGAGPPLRDGGAHRDRVRQDGAAGQAAAQAAEPPEPGADLLAGKREGEGGGKRGWGMVYGFDRCFCFSPPPPPFLPPPPPLR